MKEFGIRNIYFSVAETQVQKGSGVKEVQIINYHL